MNNCSVPYRKTLFVCVHAREGGRVSCGAPGRGGAELAAALKDEVKKAGLKGAVRVVKSGCLDLCEKGPNAFLYPGDEWLSGLTPADAPALVKRLTE